MNWQKKIKIRFTPKAKELLAEKGFDPNLGARPLKRVIQKLILDPLALKIVAGEIESRERVLVDVKGGKIHFLTSKEIVKIGKKKERVQVK